MLDNTGTVTVSCENDYFYGGESIATITCKTTVDNNNFPASCRSTYFKLDAASHVSSVILDYWYFSFCRMT